MKNMITKAATLVAACLAIVALEKPASAANSLMHFDVPFSFVAGEKTMPAGTYWVRVDGDFHLLEVAPVKGTEKFRVRLKDSSATRSVTDLNKGVLTFRRYGSTFVLKSVFAPGAAERRDVPPSKVEAELADRTAPGAVMETTVTLQ